MSDSLVPEDGINIDLDVADVFWCVYSAKESRATYKYLQNNTQIQNLLTLLKNVI